MADEFEPGGGLRAIGMIKAGSRYMYAAFASMSMDAIDAVALNRDEDCMMLRRGAQQSLRCDLEALVVWRSSRAVSGVSRTGGTCGTAIAMTTFSIHTPLYPAGPTMAQI